MIDVVIADDHTLMLESLAEALDSIPDIRVVATASDGKELLAQTARYQPKVLLVDIEMPQVSGIAALHEMSNNIPAIVVTMHTGDAERRQAEAAGAVGFLSKATPLPDLAAAVRAAAAGEDLLDDENLPEILDRHRAPKLDAGAASLTAREREILRLLAQGVSATDELADLLYISQKTVKNHLANIYDKLAVADRAQAAVEAIRLGLHRETPTESR
ncbi:MAG TPA: response regulator transcription factor [Acidimicrobiia bacterium]|jgi:DNA-binding NarL/FixJ family response regulator|nr:response regulator transcription factor [Acidimicrobiia bacterium]